MHTNLEIYRQGRHATILLSSHNMREVERLCDFIVIMGFGRVIEMGTKEELLERYDRPSLHEVFIRLARSGQYDGPSVTRLQPDAVSAS
jgi:ABC-2 type transport system ATP-binding protein